MKRTFIIFGVFISVIIVVIFYCNYLVVNDTKSFLFNDVNVIPHNKAAVLLGTSKYLKKGKINEYWQNRIDATVLLFNAKKVEVIIISGDNSKFNYNEPSIMKKELVSMGVPDSIIYLDYAGFRTFDSMIRASRIFGQNAFTVVSQEFHNQRAVYIARHYGIRAIGLNAKDVTAYNGFKTKVREKFARVKIFIDFMVDKQPKFLGPKIII